MPIDPSISLQVQAPANPLDQAAKAMTLKHLSDQSSLQPLQTQAAQQSLQTGQLQQDQIKRQMAEADALKKSFVIGDDGKLDAEATYTNMSKVNPQIASEWMTTKLKNDEGLQKSLQERHTRLKKDMSDLATPIQIRMDELVKQGIPEAAAFEKVKPLIEGGYAHMAQLYPKDVTGGADKITPDTLRQAAMHNPEYMKAHMDKGQAQSAEGKIEADFKAGRITQKQRDEALKKKDYIRPVINVNAKGGDAGGFEGRNGEILAAMAEQGVSLPAGFRSKAQQLGLLNAVSKRNPDLTPDQIASKIKSGQLDLKGLTKEVQVAGTQAGKIAYAENEIEQTIPLVREASAKLPRGKFVPYEKLKQMGEKEFSDPDLAEFKMYMTSLSNAYDMLAARGGTDMEKRKENRKNFDTAQSPEALERILVAVQKEAQASGRAAKKSMDVTHRGQDTPTDKTPAKTSGGATVSNW